MPIEAVIYNMPNISNSRITWDSKDWMAGLHPQFPVTLTQSIPKGGNYLANSKSFNPYRYLGYACPGYNPEDVTTSSIINGNLLNGVVNVNLAYIVSQSSRLHRFNLISEDLVNDTSGTGFPHDITHGGSHTGISGSDIVLYNSKLSGTSSLRSFYSFSDNQDWDIGIHDFASPANFDDDFMSTLPTTPLANPYKSGGATFPHPLIVGDDDVLYVGDRNYIHAYDGQDSSGANGKFIPEVLKIPNGYIITAFARLNTYLVAFAYFSPSGGPTDSFYLSSSKAFFWDYLSLDPFKIVDLNDNYVSEAFEYNGTIGCTTSGRSTDFTVDSRRSKIKLYNGSIFKDLVKFNGNPPTRGGIDIQGSEIRWLSSSGSGDWNIYSYGNQFGQDNVVNKIGQINGSTNYEGGMLKTFTSSLMVGSTGTSSAGKLQKCSRNFDNQSNFFTSLAEPQFQYGKKARAKYISIHFARNCASGRALTLQIYDREGNITTLLNNQEVISTSDSAIRFEHDYLGNPLPDFDAVRLVCSWSTGSNGLDAPIISYVNLDYELINT